MRSPEFRKFLGVGAVVIVASCSSALAPEISATTDGLILNVEGQVSIIPNPNDAVLIVDLPGGLDSENSIAKAKRYMKNVGCNIVNSRSEKSMGKTIGESVLVEKSCLPLK